MKKILLIHSCSIEELGGAELSLKQHLHAKPNNIDVDIILPDTTVDNLSDYHTVIVANIRPDGGKGELEEIKFARKWIKNLKYYRGHLVKLEHDIHPCTHRDAQCIEISQIPWRPCSCKSKVRETFKKLYRLCDTHIFLSPLHQKVINHIIPVPAGNQVVIASPIDFNEFKSVIPYEKRKNAALITGDAIRVSRDATELAEQAGFVPEFLDYLSVPHSQMANILNQYKAVIVSPVMFHAFGRIAVEALACGCRLITNDRVGAVSWSDPIEASKESSKKFWNVVVSTDYKKGINLKRKRFFHFKFE